MIGFGLRGCAAVDRMCKIWYNIKFGIIQDDKMTRTADMFNPSGVSGDA